MLLNDSITTNCKDEVNLFDIIPNNVVLTPGILEPVPNPMFLEVLVSVFTSTIV